MVERRKTESIKSTLELARIAAGAKAYSAKEKINPATRIFQALRIYINQELENLKLALNESIRALSSGGRLVVISYHSLEDRIVKHSFREQAALGKVRVITPHPLIPSLEEIKENRRSRSAKLRTAEII
jgi:16S rRNA (cytosine1402-N4)-methyltransferase